MCDDLRVALTVLVIDDHPIFRASVGRLLEVDGFRVVGEAANGQSGLRLARELEPDLVLLDVGLPDVSGFEVAERLVGTRTRVVLISSRAQRDLGRRVHETGAIGFISKDQLSGEAILDLIAPHEAPSPRTCTRRSCPRGRRLLVQIDNLGPFTSSERAAAIVGVAWAFLLAGLAAWSRRPANRVGPLLAAAGFALLLRQLR